MSQFTFNNSAISSERSIEPMKVFVRLRNEESEHEKTSGIKRTGSMIPGKNSVADKGNRKIGGNLSQLPSSNKSLSDKAASLLNNTGVEIIADKTIKLLKPGGGHGNEKEFTFDKVFSESTSQDEIYSQISHHVTDAVAGFNSTVFAYGSMKSGKSHTMAGSRGDPGIIPRAVKDIFAQIETSRNEDPLLFFYVEMTMVELYNNHFRNLLKPSVNSSNTITDGPCTPITPHSPQEVIDPHFESPPPSASIQYPRLVHSSDKPDKIDIHESATLGIFLSGTGLRVHVSTAEEALSLINRGLRLRTQRINKVHKHSSSRSHCVLTFHIERRQFPSSSSSANGDNNSGGGTDLIMGRLQLVDMAGSERLGSSTASSGSGERVTPEALSESHNINLTLNAVGDVLSTLFKQSNTNDRRRSQLPPRASNNSNNNSFIAPGGNMTNNISFISPNINVSNSQNNSNNNSNNSLLSHLEGTNVDDDNRSVHSIGSTRATNTKNNQNASSNFSTPNITPTHHITHIPYLNSKLTFYLKESLGGNTKTSFIFTLCSGIDHYQLSLTTLTYAMWASKIRSIVSVNRVDLGVGDGSSGDRERDPEIARLRKILEARSESFAALHVSTLRTLSQDDIGRIEFKRSTSRNHQQLHTMTPISEGEGGTGSHNTPSNSVNSPSPQRSTRPSSDLLGVQMDRQLALSLDFSDEEVRPKLLGGSGKTGSASGGGRSGSNGGCARCADTLRELETLRAQFDTQSENITRLQDSLDAAYIQHDSDLTALSERNNELETRLSEATDGLVQMQNDNSDLTEQINSLQYENNDQNTQICELSDMTQSLSQDVEALRNVNSDLTSELKSKSTLLDEAQLSVDHLTTEAQRQQTIYSEEREVYEHHIYKLSADLNESGSEARDLMGRIDGLTAQLQCSEDELNDVQTQLSDSQAREVAVNTELSQQLELSDQHNTLIDQLRNEITSLKTSFNNEKQSILSSAAGSTTAIRDLQTELVGLRAVNAELEKQMVNEHKNYLNALKQADIYTQKVVKEYQQKLKNLESELSEAQQQKQEVVYQLHEVTDRYTTLESKHTIEKQTLTETITKIEQQIITQQQTQYAHNSAQLAQLTSDLAQKCSEIAQLRSDLLHQKHTENELKLTITLLQTKLDTSLTECDEITSKWTSEVEEGGAQLASLQRKFDMLAAASVRNVVVDNSNSALLASKDIEIHRLTQTLSDTHIALHSAQSEVDSLQCSIEENDTGYTIRLRELERLLGTKSEKINMLLEKSATTNNALEELRVNKDNEIAMFRERQTTLEIELNTVKHQLHDTQTQLTTLAASPPPRSLQSSELSSNLAAKDSEISDLQTQVASLSTVLKSTTTALKTLQTQFAALQEQHGEQMAISARESSAANDRAGAAVEAMSRKAEEVRRLQEDITLLRTQQLNNYNNNHPSALSSPVGRSGGGGGVLQKARSVDELPSHIAQDIEALVATGLTQDEAIEAYFLTYCNTDSYNSSSSSSSNKRNGNNNDAFEITEDVVQEQFVSPGNLSSRSNSNHNSNYNSRNSSFYRDNNNNSRNAGTRTPSGGPQISPYLHNPSAPDTHNMTVRRSPGAVLSRKNSRGVNSNSNSNSNNTSNNNSMYNSPYHNHNQLQQSSNNNVPPLSPNLGGSEQQYVVSQPWRDPDQEALEIGLLLSVQESLFGVNMRDALTSPQDVELINSIMSSAGVSRNEAMKRVFEGRFGGGVAQEENNVMMSLPITRSQSSDSATSSSHSSPANRNNIQRQSMYQPQNGSNYINNLYSSNTNNANHNQMLLGSSSSSSGGAGGRYVSPKPYSQSNSNSSSGQRLSPHSSNEHILSSQIFINTSNANNNHHNHSQTPPLRVTPTHRNITPVRVPSLAVVQQTQQQELRRHTSPSPQNTPQLHNHLNGGQYSVQQDSWGPQSHFQSVPVGGNPIMTSRGPSRHVSRHASPVPMNIINIQQVQPPGSPTSPRRRVYDV